MDSPSRLSNYEVRVQVRLQGRLLLAPRILFVAAGDAQAVSEGLAAVRERYRQPKPGTEIVSVEICHSDEQRRVSYLTGAGLRWLTEPEPPPSS